MLDGSIFNYDRSTSAILHPTQGSTVVLPLTNVQGIHLDSLRVMPLTNVQGTYLDSQGVMPFEGISDSSRVMPFKGNLSDLRVPFEGILYGALRAAPFVGVVYNSLRALNYEYASSRVTPFIITMLTPRLGDELTISGDLCSPATYGDSDIYFFATQLGYIKYSCQYLTADVFPLLALVAQKMKVAILYLTSIFYMIVENFLKFMLLNPDFLLLWVSSPAKSRNTVQLLKLFMCRNLFL
jgi:hypothetical protein